MAGDEAIQLGGHRALRAPCDDRRLEFKGVAGCKSASDRTGANAPGDLGGKDERDAGLDGELAPGALGVGR